MSTANPDTRRPARSLLHRLWAATTLIVAVMALGTTAISYGLAYQDAKEQQDLQLRQIAGLARRFGELPRAVLQPRGEDIDADTRIVVTHPGESTGGLRLPGTLTDGLHDVIVGGATWRVVVIGSGQDRLAVAQRTGVRLDGAIDGAIRTLVPLLALIPLLMLFSAWIVRRALRPVWRLGRELDVRDAGALEPLATDAVPGELRPFLASINQLLARLSQLMRRERRFIADAAHALRTPIAALSLQAENLARMDLAPEAHRRLESLHEGMARIRVLVEQLLDLARVQHGEHPLRWPLEPAKVLRQVIEDCLPVAQQRHIDLGIARDEGGPILAEEWQVYLLLRNAVDNALRYTPTGGRVDLAVYGASDAALGRELIIEVCDDGPGIPPRELPRLLEPFERLEREDAPSGSGLGLAIMRNVARNLGWRLELENRPAGGLCVRYRQPALPLTEPH